MKRKTLIAGFATFIVITMMLSASANAGSKQAFGFNSSSIAGFNTGSAKLTGGGAFNLSTGFVKSAGGFRCTTDINQGPLNGCHAGEGVRWDTVALLPSTGFKCTQDANEILKTGFTSADTVVLTADFYRAGDGEEESFTANMIVSSQDIAPDISGVQNVWIQGVGCGVAVVTFSE